MFTEVAGGGGGKRAALAFEAIKEPVRGRFNTDDEDTSLQKAFDFHALRMSVSSVSRPLEAECMAGLVTLMLHARGWLACILICQNYQSTFL